MRYVIIKILFSTFTEVIAAIKSQGTQTTQIENTDLKQTISEKR